jgi:hypothetical protein
MSDIPLTGEVSNSKLAAVFDDAPAARAAAATVAGQADLQPAQVKVVTPDEPDPGLKLEPEGRGIWHTILTAHLWLGLVGVTAGVVVFAAMLWAGVPVVVASPGYGLLAMAFLGGMAGLLLAGLLALRPDHDRYIQATRTAMKQQRSTVVVHALSAEQAETAAQTLTALGAKVTRTL